MSKVKDEIPSNINLATTSALTAAENKIPTFSNLVKKTGYNTKKWIKLKRKLPITIMINILLLHNWISLQNKFLI